MGKSGSRVCPVELAGSLDTCIRRWVQNPRKILGPYVKEGMMVLDVGCGPGFFSLEMARMVGSSGRVIAADLQEGMLRKIRNKIAGSELEHRLILHRCGENTIGLAEQVDFILLFYMVHEVADKVAFFQEIAKLLKPGGLVLIVEPPLHVAKSAFAKTIRIARDAGLRDSQGPGVFLSKTALLQKD